MFGPLRDSWQHAQNIKCMSITLANTIRIAVSTTSYLVYTYSPSQDIRQIVFQKFILFPRKRIEK